MEEEEEEEMDAGSDSSAVVEAAWIREAGRRAEEAEVGEGEKEEGGWQSSVSSEGTEEDGLSDITGSASCTSDVQLYS